MAKIWKNRIEAGTQKLANCPMKYRVEVISLIKADLTSGNFKEVQLQLLVQEGKLTSAEYQEITGKQFN